MSFPYTVRSLSKSELNWKWLCVNSDFLVVALLHFLSVGCGVWHVVLVLFCHCWQFEVDVLHTVNAEVHPSLSLFSVLHHKGFGIIQIWSRFHTAASSGDLLITKSETSSFTLLFDSNGTTVYKTNIMCFAAIKPRTFSHALLYNVTICPLLAVRDAGFAAPTRRFCIFLTYSCLYSQFQFLLSCSLFSQTKLDHFLPPLKKTL